MTNNQINYAKHREDVRHNKSSEQIGKQQADAATSQAAASHRQASVAEQNVQANYMQAQAALSQAAAAHRNATTNYQNYLETVRHQGAVDEYMSEYYDYAKYSNPVALGKGLLNSAKGLASKYAANYTARQATYTLPGQLSWGAK